MNAVSRPQARVPRDAMGETLHRTLVYFGLADDEPEPASAAVSDETRVLLDALERRVAENAAEIAALRAEVAQLRAQR